MTRYVKTGVAIPRKLAAEFDVVLEGLGVTSRSQGVRMAIRNFIALNSWRAKSDVIVAGAVLVHYNHEKPGVEDELTDVQHEYMNVIVSTLHVHVSEKECIQIIAVKGPVEPIKSLVARLTPVRGVINVVPTIVTTL
ncbi:MAG: CopG family transcriptional regulator [Thermoprotei archaeon]|nr:CopG family transcriptional regulator [Thermoprotei archaeon]